LKTTQEKEVNRMGKRALLKVFVVLSFALVPCYFPQAHAGWSNVDIGNVNNDLWAIWGSSENDVYVMGTSGINLHYDGNQAGDWLILPAISP